MDAENPFPAERTAVITGAASARGIGRATADRLARDGWSIAILDLDGEAAKRPSPRSKPPCPRSSAWPTWPG
jgi:2-hydroxycyclohexanecarboxyl-CoA dehydrogenase